MFDADYFYAMGVMNFIAMPFVVYRFFTLYMDWQDSLRTRTFFAYARRYLTPRYPLAVFGWFLLSLVPVLNQLLVVASIGGLLVAALIWIVNEIVVS